jgi:glycosyltransferase involved in cell wall biosynthesis
MQNGKTRDPAARLRVLWLIKGLGPGGAEQLLVEHARIGDWDAVEYEVAYLLPWKRQLVPELQERGVTSHCLEARTVADPRWLLRLRRLVRTRSIEVVHVHSPALAAVARPMLRMMRRRPALVYTEHYRWPGYRLVTRFANRATLGLDDATIAVSEAVRDSMGGHRDRVVVIRHGVDLDGVRAHLADRDTVRAELGVRPDEMLVVTVANLRPAKGYPCLLEAARAVLDCDQRVRFVAAGQGPQEDELRAIRARLGLDERFRLLGYVPDGARLIAGADLFVLASVHEGLPVAVMEALALGVPVVATRVGGIPELIEPGEDGLLVEPGDAGALAGAIDAALEPTVRSRLAAGARRRGEGVAGTEAVQRLDDLYRSLACARRGAGVTQADGPRRP